MEYKRKLEELGITLNSSGRQICPRCSNERKNKLEKCLTVTYTDTAVLYNCHHCGWNGSVYYRDKFYNKKVYFKPTMQQPKKENKELIDFFAKRCISEKTLEKYNITLNEKNEIQIPYYKNKELVNIKYRTFDKKFRQEKETEKTLYGMDLVDINNPLIIVEGEMDVLALAEVNIYAVSVPQGGNDSKLECIENCWDFVKNFKEFVIAVDNDKVGDELKQNLLNRFGKDNCKVVNWGKFKDANEVLIAGENLVEYIASASLLLPDNIDFYWNYIDEVYKEIYEEDIDFYSTGWKSLDEFIKLRFGHLMVVTGYPSRGKSTFVDNLLVNLSKKYGIKHLIASFESTIENSYINILEMIKQKPLKYLKEDTKETIGGEIYGFISEHFYRLSNDKHWNIDEIIDRTELMVKKYGIKTLVIDPYNRLNNNYSDREDKYVGSILSKLCMLTKKYNILVIFLAHPKKPGKEEKIPNMYSISGSGDWYNMADYGIVVHRDRNDATGELDNTPQIIIEKVKNFRLGKPSGGFVRLKYNLEKRILEDIN